MKTKKIGLISVVSFFLSACGSYGKPPLSEAQARASKTATAATLA